MAGTERPIDALFLDCVHCGYCLPTCPSYAVLGTEMDSPRGRIDLMRALSEESLAPTRAVTRHLDTCLLCRGCETACPSGVQFGVLMEATRTRLAARRHRPWLRAGLNILTRRRVLHFLARAAALAQRTGLLRAAARVPGLSAAELLPPVAPRAERRAIAGARYPAVGNARGRVGLLRGCVADELYARVTRDAIALLTRCGYEVVMPPAQTCCGAPQTHAGEQGAARELAQRNIDAFAAADVEVVLSTAAGCGAALRSYEPLFAADPVWRDRARAFVARVRDVTEFLAALPALPPLQPRDCDVAYHDPCHLAHAQRIREAPRDLVRRIPGLRVQELDDGELCCGSAGVYNLLQPAIARELQRRKVECIRATGAQIVATANPGCLLQIEAGLRAARLPVRAVHVVELLAAALPPQGA